MDFSAWDWATHFRLHEAACLIAGVMPLSKKMPTSEDLPPQARPILLKLMGAYYEWYLQAKNPERPKTITLRGNLNEDETLPEFPVPTVLIGEIVSRAAIRDFISDMGRKSAYDFNLIEQKKPFAPVEGAPIVEAPASETPEPPAPPVVAADASSGSAMVWTTERKEAARAMMNEQRGQGMKAFAANTAAAFGVTPTRLREVLNDKRKKAPAKKPKGLWDV